MAAQFPDYVNPAITPHLDFRLHVGREMRCSYPHRRDWRQLPFVLIEQIVEGTYVIDRPGKPPLRCSDGGTFVIPPGMRQRLTIPRGVQCLVRWIHADFTVDAHAGADLFSLLQEPLLVPPAASRPLGHLLQQLAAQWDPAPFPSMAVLVEQNQLLSQVALFFLRHSPELAARTADLSHRKLVPVLRHIRENLHRPLTRAELARVAGLSSTRFHYVFQEELGQAPMEYVRALRMKVAKELLVRGDLSIKQIAEKTGFGDAFYFSRLFKQMTGQTPTSYRDDLKG